MASTVDSNTRPGSGTASNNGGALHQASSNAHAAVETIAGAADDAASKIRPAISQAAATAHQAVDRAAGAAAPTAEWLNQQGESLNTAQKKLVTGTSGYISANPLKAIGIAAAVGFLLSRITR